METWTVEVLHKRHNRRSFDCGEPALNEFLDKYALQQQEKNLGKTFVAVENDTVIGFYTLSAGSIRFDDLPESDRRKLPKYPVPIARIGRLAVDRKVAGRGLGNWLLMHAIGRIVRITDLGIFAIVVDAKGEKVETFYEKYGFRRLSNAPHTLFLPMRTIQRELR